MNFKNKKVVITGAGSGIGYAESKILLEAGAQVFSFDVQKPKEPVKGVKYLKVDITKSRQIQKAFKKVGQPIDVLINNAGIMRRGDIFNTLEKDYDLLFNINAKGAWLMIKYGRDYLKKDATVLNMSSRHGLYPPPDPAIYGLTKKVILYLGRILKETSPGLRVKIACPGSTYTPLSCFGVKEKELAKKKKTMKSPEFVAQKIIELIESDYEYLIYDPNKNKYNLSNELPKV